MAINKILGGGTPQDDPFAAAKRKIFLGATPAGILIMLAVWGIGLKQNNNTVLDILVLPLLTFLFLILIVLLWRRIMPLHTFELIFYTLVLAYALCEFVFIIINHHPNKWFIRPELYALASVYLYHEFFGSENKPGPAAFRILLFCYTDTRAGLLPVFPVPWPGIPENFISAADVLYQRILYCRSLSGCKIKRTVCFGTDGCR